MKGFSQVDEGNGGRASNSIDQNLCLEKLKKNTSMGKRIVFTQKEKVLGLFALDVRLTLKIGVF